MQLTAAQTKAFDLAVSGSKQVVVYGGGIRGGKTWWLLATFVYLCSKYPRSRWLLVRQSLPTLKRTLLVSFQRFLEEGLAAHVVAFNRDTLTVTFRNGSQLIFMAESYEEDKELNRFRGLEINGAGGDEINELQEVTFRKLLERAGSWNGAEGYPPPLVLGTCNPSDNWVKRVLYEPYVAGTLPESWAYLPALILDNPHIPTTYLASLRANLLPQDYRRFVEGDWSAQRRENLFAEEFREEVHVDPAAVLRPDQPLWVSVDFNLNPFGVVFGHAYQEDGRLCVDVFDEAEVPHGSLPVMVDLIRSRYAPQLGGCRLTGDYNGKAGQLALSDRASHYQQLQRGLGLREAQLKVTPNPYHADSRADVNWLLWQSTLPGGRARVRVAPRCEGLLRDLRSVQCDAYGQLLKKNRKDLAQRADLLDGFRYLVHAAHREGIDRAQKTTARLSTAPGGKVPAAGVA